MSIFNTTIEWNQETGEERNALVTYVYFPAHRGVRDSLGGKRGAGPPLEPDEPPSVEITSVMMDSPTAQNPEDTVDILDQLTREQVETLEEKCMDDVREQYASSMEDRYER
jgi:hypothetical protein